MAPRVSSQETRAQRLWRWVRRSSIRRKILGIVFIGGVVPVTIALVLLWFGMNAALDEGVARFLIDRIRVVEGRINDEVGRIVADSERIAADVDRQGPEALPPGCHLVRSAGESLMLEGVHITERRTPDDPIGQLVVTVPLSHESAWVECPYPVQEIVGTVLEPMANDFSVSVVNSSREAVTAVRPEILVLFDRLLQNGDGPLEAWDRSESIGGDPHIVALRRVHGLRNLRSEGRAEGRWAVIAHFNLAPLLADLEVRVWSMGAVALLVVAFFLGVGVMLAQRIIQPLRMMSHEANEIAAGNFNLRVEVHTNDELQELADHMNTMALRLDSTLNDLEGKLRLLREKTAQLETLRSLAQAISKAFDRPHLLRVFERETRRCVGFDLLWVARLLPGEHHAEITHIAWGDIPPSDLWSEGKRIPLRNSRVGRSIDLRRAILAIDLEQSTERHWEDEPLRSLAFRSILVIPLASPDMVHGAVGFASRRPAQLGAMQADLLSTACVQLAIGLEHAELHRELQSLADELESKVRERTEELHFAQRRLFQQEKFAATGQLAASVAHEINNPLAIIKNHLALLHGSTEDESLQVIREEIDRIARIINSLLSFHRPSTQGALEGQVDVNPEIETLVRLVERALQKRGVALSLDLAADLPPVKATSDLLRQVILNLLRNAEDAVSEGDTLRVATSSEEGMVLLRVADTGSGIAPEHLTRIFDPFFTTKEESGTGLGLSVTFGIVESLGGSIEVESEVGRGTTVTVRLPCA